MRNLRTGSKSADGIYVDGGTDIIIERNIVHNCNLGIEAASEHSGRTTDYITVRSNFIYNCDVGGLFFGGYDSSVGSAAAMISPFSLAAASIAPLVWSCSTIARFCS